MYIPPTGSTEWVGLTDPPHTSLHTYTHTQPPGPSTISKSTTTDDDAAARAPSRRAGRGRDGGGGAAAAAAAGDGRGGERGGCVGVKCALMCVYAPVHSGFCRM